VINLLDAQVVGATLKSKNIIWYVDLEVGLLPFMLDNDMWIDLDGGGILFDGSAESPFGVISSGTNPVFLKMNNAFFSSNITAPAMVFEGNNINIKMYNDSYLGEDTIGDGGALGVVIDVFRDSSSTYDALAFTGPTINDNLSDLGSAVSYDDTAFSPPLGVANIQSAIDVLKQANDLDTYHTYLWTYDKTWDDIWLEITDGYSDGYYGTILVESGNPSIDGYHVINGAYDLRNFIFEGVGSSKFEYAANIDGVIKNYTGAPIHLQNATITGATIKSKNILWYVEADGVTPFMLDNDMWIDLYGGGMFFEGTAPAGAITSGNRAVFIKLNNAFIDSGMDGYAMLIDLGMGGYAMLIAGDNININLYNDSFLGPNVFGDGGVPAVEINMFRDSSSTYDVTAISVATITINDNLVDLSENLSYNGSNVNPRTSATTIQSAMDGNRIQTNINKRWTPFETTDYSTAGDGYFNTSIDLRPIIRRGFPLRAFWSEDGIIKNDIFNEISSLPGGVVITGISLTNIDENGILYVQIVEDALGIHHIDLFKAPGNTPGDAASIYLVGHTAAYAAPGTEAIIADNDSGIGGTITILAVTQQNLDVTIEYFTWHIVTSTFENQLQVAGPSTPTNIVDGLWWGNTELVAQSDLFVPGAWNDAYYTGNLLDSKSNTAMQWRAAPARAARVSCYSKTIIDPVYVNISIDGYDIISSDGIGDGISIDTSKTWEHSDNNIIRNLLRIEQDSNIEISTDFNDNGDAENLTVSITWVLE